MTVKENITCYKKNVTFLVTFITFYVVDLFSVEYYNIYEVTTMDKNFYYEYKNLGNNIAYFRKKRELSQLQLAEIIDISRTHMSRIETADCSVSLDVVFAICKALNISPTKLFDFRD